jgi:hypothetical protein
MTYFTPSIEDIRIGYECEIRWNYQNKEYRKEELTIEQLSSLMSKFDYEGFCEDCVRVPYLTKEQIEAEGWKYKSGGEYEPTYEKGWDGNSWWEFTYDPDGHFITIEFWKVNSKTNNYDCFTKFDGACKDINTFRYICKLLGI